MRRAFCAVYDTQEVAFLGLWWLVDEVQYDLTSVNPQAAGETGDGVCRSGMTQKSSSN